MKISDIKIKSLRQILSARAKQSDSIRITFTAFKRNDERGTKLIENADIKNLANINKLLTIEDFVRVRLEVFDRNVSETDPEKTYEYADETLGGGGFSGFGEVSDTERNRVNELYYARKREEEREKLLVETEQQKTKIEELENDLSDAEDALQQANEKIKSLQSLKSYAQLAGVALGELGLKKPIKSALAGIMGDDDDENGDNETPIHIDQTSGVIETPDTDQHQTQELIGLVTMCMATMDKTTLGIVFSLFSEIEKDETVAFQLYAIYNKLKSKNTINSTNLQTQQNQTIHETDDQLPD
jgi:hypothetical protein